jgi:hypothetical protein
MNVANTSCCSCNCKTCNQWGSDKHCGKSENGCYKRSS